MVPAPRPTPWLSFDGASVKAAQDPPLLPSSGGLLRRLQHLRDMVVWRPPLQATLASTQDLHQAARQFLPKMVMDYVDGGTDAEETLRRNEDAFRSVHFRPRVLSDVRGAGTSTTLLGRELPMPVLLGPAGLVRLVRREGDLAVARAASQAGAVYVLSTASGYTIEEVRSVSGGPLWFQLYLSEDKGECQGLLSRALNSGYEALVLTIDTPNSGNRLRDGRNGFSIPPRVPVKKGIGTLAHPGWLREIIAEPQIGLRNFASSPAPPGRSPVGLSNHRVNNPSLTWQDVDWLREHWPKPLLVKGVMSGDVAKELMSRGADGVVVSNHGGRQLDGLSSALEALVEVRAALGAGAVVLVDGGVRSGVDVAKALALGATAVAVVRPWVWGLAAAGQAGVEACLEIFQRELLRTMQLLGATNVGELDQSFIELEWGKGASA